MEYGVEQRTVVPKIKSLRVLGDGHTATVARFAVHFLEMILAMMVGMMVLGAAVGGVLAAVGRDFGTEQERHPALFAVVMAINMTAGMAAWMRFRGHSGRSVAEMGGAMVVPVLVLLPPFWMGFVGGDALIGLEHVLMLPAMLSVMLYRREHYSHHDRPRRERSQT